MFIFNIQGVQQKIEYDGEHLHCYKRWCKIALQQGNSKNDRPLIN